MIFTTNKPLAAWGRVLHDADLAEALLDRVLERGRHLELRGRSYRTRDAPVDLTPASEPPSPEPARISGNQRPQFSEPTHVALEGRCNTSTTFVRPSRSRSFLSARWQGSSISIAGRCSLLTDCAAALRATGSEAERRRHRAGRRLPRRRGRCWLCDAQPAALRGRGVSASSRRLTSVVALAAACAKSCAPSSRSFAPCSTRRMRTSSRRPATRRINATPIWSAEQSRPETHGRLSDLDLVDDGEAHLDVLLRIRRQPAW